MADDALYNGYLHEAAFFKKKKKKHLRQNKVGKIYLFLRRDTEAHSQTRIHNETG